MSDNSTLHWIIIALVLGLVLGYVAGSINDPMMIVKDPANAFKNAFGMSVALLVRKQ